MGRIVYELDQSCGIKADDIYGTRAVISDIWELIWTSKLAVAIVTDQNPNVNYELSMCHNAWCAEGSRQ